MIYDADGCRSSNGGINALFSWRAERVVLRDIPVRSQKPDRVLGLIKTKKFSGALDSLVKVRKKVVVSPFDGQGDEPLIFPFLILEAKRNDPQITIRQIEHQTGFPIRSLLKLQEDLYNRCKESGMTAPEPLVWFLATRGVDVVIYGCYKNMPLDQYVRNSCLYNGD